MYNINKFWHSINWGKSSPLQRQHKTSLFFVGHALRHWQKWEKNGRTFVIALQIQFGRAKECFFYGVCD